MRDNEYMRNDKERGGSKGEITPRSRCDGTGRDSARRVVFTRHQIGSNLSIYQAFRFHREHIQVFPRGGEAAEKKSPSIRRIVRRIKPAREYMYR